jgi:hypothetical protein
MSGASTTGSPSHLTAETHFPETLDADNEDIVDHVVRVLNAICKTATFDFAMSVGKLIIDRFYSGDLGSWRERGPKNVSFRKLAKHPDLPMSPSALYRSVAIYELSSRLGFNKWRYVSTSHFRVVLPLSSDLQSSLLLQAEEEAWTVDRLRTAIGDAKRDVPEDRGGRRKTPRLRKTLRTIERCLDDNSLVGAKDDDVEFSPDSAHSVGELMRRLQQACAALENTVSDSERAAPVGRSVRDVANGRR